MIVAVDFIPPRVRAHRRSRARVRAWCGVVAALAAVLSVSFGVLLAHGDDTSAGVGEELLRVKGKLEREAREHAAINERIAGAEAGIALSRAIGRHPDWSVLLDLLALERGEDVVLSRVSVRPVEVAASAPGPASLAKAVRADAYRVRIAGQARTQAAATSFPVRLEEMKLFDSVGAVETRPIVVRGKPYVGFEVECAIGQRAPGTNGGAGR